MPLTDPISATNITNELRAYASNAVNFGIIWHSQSKPFTEFPDGILAGTFANPGISARFGNILTEGDSISAGVLIEKVIEEVNFYTSIRQLRARLFVTGTDRFAPGTFTFDATNTAHFNRSWLQITNRLVDAGSVLVPGTIGSTPVSGTTAKDWAQIRGIFRDAIIYRSALLDSYFVGLESWFLNLSQALNLIKTTNVIEYTVSICHSSCHNSCHGSRVRR